MRYPFIQPQVERYQLSSRTQMNADKHRFFAFICENLRESASASEFCRVAE